eukprot:3737339-Rhodomonas_salina.1
MQITLIVIAHASELCQSQPQRVTRSSNDEQKDSLNTDATDPAPSHRRQTTYEQQDHNGPGLWPRPAPAAGFARRRAASQPARAR